MSLISLFFRISACAGVQCLALRPAFAQTVAAIQDAVRNAVTQLDLQTEIPGDPQYDWFDLNLPVFNFSTSLFWTAIAIAVALVLYSVRDDLPRLIFGQSRRWGNLGAEDGGISGPASHQQAALNADELARQGYYVEAMHVLLLRAFAEMRERLGVDFAASLTSREILRRSKLPEIGKAPLRDIINRVELSYFGAYPAADGDYAACRESFDRFMGLLDEEGSRS
jgi:hypothetical protein